MVNPYSWLKQYFIGNYLGETSNIFVRARIQVIFDYSLIILLTTIPYQVVLLQGGYVMQFYINLLAFITGPAILYILKLAKNVKAAGLLFSFIQIILSIGHGVLYNFIPSVQGSLWILLGVLIAFFIVGPKTGIITSIIFAAVLLFSAFNLESNFAYFPQYFTYDQGIPESGLNLLIPIGLNTYLLWLIIRTTKKAEIELMQSYKENEDLLLNILPEETAAELKEKGKAKAQLYDNVTILFADIQGFSKIAEELPAQELVGQLDKHFRAFDEILSEHHIEKIKTIGDAYLCICGAPTENEDHAFHMIKAAKSFLEASQRIRSESIGPSSFNFRIGIHSGSIVAGVVGIKKFAYDIWGDAVNIAARMEQNGEAGKINISESTYELIQNRVSCSFRGEIDAKNKGLLKMYFVE